MHWELQPREDGANVFVFVPEKSKSDKSDKVSNQVHDYNESDYSFEVLRVRDKETNLVTLKINVTIQVDDQDPIIIPFPSTMATLDSTLKDMCNYGIVFTDSNNLIKLKNTIQREYKKLDWTDESQSDSLKEKLDAVLCAVCEFIVSDKQEDNKECYYIPVGIFNEIASDCGYASYEMRKLRQELAKESETGHGPYIRKVGNRYAIMVNYHNKATRVLAFYKEPLAEKLRLMKNAHADEQTEAIDHEN